jgi:hypothetical protein
MRTPAVYPQARAGATRYPGVRPPEIAVPTRAASAFAVLLPALVAAALGGCVGGRGVPRAAPQAELARVLGSADALRVRSGGVTGTVPGLAVHETLLETRAAEVLAAFATCVEVDWGRRPGQACTPGWPTFELDRQGIRVGTFAVIDDGFALRWLEDPAWRSDLVLTPRGTQRLRAWMRSQGVPDPRAWFARHAQSPPR